LSADNNGFSESGEAPLWRESAGLHESPSFIS
jgi:hypothetical protein